MYWLGAITGSSGFASNVATGPSGVGTFQIPQRTKEVYLQPSSTGIAFAFGFATGASFSMAPNQQGYLDGPQLINGPFRMAPPSATGVFPVVALYATGAAFWSVGVWAAPTS